MENGNNSNISSDSITPEEALEVLRALRARIPDYTQKPIYTPGLLRTVGNLDPEFIDASTAAIGASEHLQKALDTSASACNAELTAASRWAQVESEASAMLIGIRNANRTRRHRIGVRALQAYQMTKQLLRAEQHSDLKPHLEEMRRHNRLGRPRRKPAQPPDETPAQ